MTKTEPKEGAGAVQSIPQPVTSCNKIIVESTRNIKPTVKNSDVKIIGNSRSPILVTREEFVAFDEFHQAGAIVLQRRGWAIIEWQVS